jgi:hypothetical protein
MAKFQLCEFRRKRPVYTDMSIVPNKMDGWERGLAKVRDFGTGEVELFLDEHGNKIKEPWRYRLLRSYAHGTIDTEIIQGTVSE